MEKLGTILLMLAYFTGLYAIGKCVVAVVNAICGCFQK
jgi:hypothetical protein